MSFKLVASQVIFEPKFSMIINRTLQPSYRSFKSNAIRRKVSTASHSLCCCSLTLDKLPLTKLWRKYSTNFSSEVTRIENAEYYPNRADRVNKYLQSLTGQARKSGGSLKRFEPCYRPLYPSKKCPKPTYKIPRKLPYVPAVFQPRKKLTFKNKVINSPSTKNRVLGQWPPLYKCKKRETERKSKGNRPETSDLPPWLLPLYSYKAGRPGDDNVRFSEALFSGGAFQRRMEILEGIKEIQNEQALRKKSLQLNAEITKHAVNKTPQLSISKEKTAVNELRRRIGEMYSKMSSSKRSGSLQKTQQRRKESETIKENKDNKDGKLDKQFNSSPEKLSDDKMNKHPGSFDQMKTVDDHSAQNSVNGNHDVQTLFSSSNLSEIKGTHKPASESKPVNFQVSPHSYLKDSTLSSRNAREKKDQSVINKEDVSADGNEWSVQSLKLKINDMLSYEQDKLNKITSKYRNVVEIPKSHSEGINAQVNKPSNRSFHRCSMKHSVPKLKKYSSSRGFATSSIYAQLNVNRVGVGGNRSIVCKRRLSKMISLLNSTERPNKQPVRMSSIQGPECSAKKPSWIIRMKRCLVIKKTKRPKVDDWKKTPRMIASGIECVDRTCSPSPVLWKPKENCVPVCRSENQAVQTNPVVLNAERRIMASINRMVPSPSQNVPRNLSESTTNSDTCDIEEKPKFVSTNQSCSSTLDQNEAADRLSEIEKKVRRAELRVGILPLPWPKEVKHVDKIAKLPELSSFQSDKLSGDILNEIEKKEETGYQWITNNRQTVEDIKHRSREFAGKPLVPYHVKQSIEEYRLPLKAKIAQYRKNIAGRAHGLYLYSTSRRLYSTSCGRDLPYLGFTNSISCANPKFLHRCDMCRFGTRSLTNDASGSDKYQSRGTQLKPNAVPDTPVKSGFYSRYDHRPIYGDFNRDEPFNRLAKDSNSTKKLSNIPITAANMSQRIVAPLTSPNKMINKGGDTISPSLRKQVDDLKRLIRKSKGLDQMPEKVDVPGPMDDAYLVRLRKLVKAAQATAKRLNIIEPNNQTENDVARNISGIDKRNIKHEPLKVQEPVKPALYNSPPSTSTLFTKLENDSRVQNKNNLKTKPQISRSVSVDSLQVNKKPFHNMYSRFKSFVESVRRKSTQERLSDTRIIPNNKLKGSLSLEAFLPSGEKKMVNIYDNECVNKANNISCSNESITVELRGGDIAKPANSIQLWKSEHHPKLSNSDKTLDVEDCKPVVGPDIADNKELMSLLTRAKELFNVHSQLNAEEHANITRLADRNPSVVFAADVKNIPVDCRATDINSVKILSPEEITRNLLTKPETVKNSSQDVGIRVWQKTDATSEVNSQFWPSLTFLPQAVFGKMDHVQRKETSRTYLEDTKPCDKLKSLAVQNTIASDSITPSIKSENEKQNNVTSAVSKNTVNIMSNLPDTCNFSNLKNLNYQQDNHSGLLIRNTMDNSKVQHVPREIQLVTANDSPNCEVPNSENSDSNDISSVASRIRSSTNLKNVKSRNDATSSVQPLPGSYSSLTQNEVPAVNNQYLHGYDFKVSDNANLKSRKETNYTNQAKWKDHIKEQGNHCGSFLQTSETQSKAQNIVPQELKAVTQSCSPKYEIPSSAVPASDDSRNDGSSRTTNEQELDSPLPKFSKEIDTSIGPEPNVVLHHQLSPRLDQQTSATNKLESDHDGNHAKNFRSHFLRDISFQAPHSYSSSNYQTHDIIDYSLIASPVDSQITNEFEYGSADEEKVEAHIDEINSHDRQSLAELLEKDPTINPELVKKLKLPVMNIEDCKEKNWCTQSRNK